MGILSDDNIFGSDVIRKERQSKTHAKNKRKDALGSNKRPRNAQTKNRSMDDSDTEFEPHALPSDNQSSSFRPKETLKLMKMSRTAKDEALNEEEENSEDSSAEIEDTENSSEELEYETNSETMTEVDELEQQAYDLDDADRKAFMNFQPPTQEYRGTLADIILAKLKENKERKKANLKDKSDTHSVHAAVDPKVARVYRAVGKVLQNYTHGKLPKAFKMMPRLTNWEELLWLTKPQEWSPSALYVATRLFASNLNEAMAQRFYYIFLLSSIGAAFETPKSECKVALHPQRYNAIHKAMFKPMAFVRGFLIPLFEEIEPSVQLTTIIASVLKKGSLQPVAAALAVVKIAGMSYTPARALILRVIIEKKTKLPEQAKDAMLSYFFSFLKKPSDTETVASQSVEKVTVIWHQLLLAYVSCYQIHADHLALFRDLCHKNFHPVLTPEVLRILSGNK